MAKFQWSGQILSIQPRIGLTRSFDQSYHSYLGYSLIVDGTIGDEEREFSIGVGKAAQQKHQLQVGDEVSGESLPVLDSKRSAVEFYKTSKLRVLELAGRDPKFPPWHGVPVELSEYRDRGHRRLSARTYGAICWHCIWGCRMPVTIIIDQWQPEKKKFRFETFCYGPKSCPIYKAGPGRRVPGRKGMVYEEPDWVDEEVTAHRGMDD